MPDGIGLTVLYKTLFQPSAVLGRFTPIAVSLVFIWSLVGVATLVQKFCAPNNQRHR